MTQTTYNFAFHQAILYKVYIRGGVIITKIRDKNIRYPSFLKYLINSVKRDEYILYHMNIGLSIYI